VTDLPNNATETTHVTQASPADVSTFTLDDWLAHCETLHPVAMDMTLGRVREVYQRMALQFKAPIVSVAGTNGKGSSCAMLESIAIHAGYRVGLHIKPHLVHFTERCRLNGQDVAPETLTPHFLAVEKARGDITLSYFEFTLLAILSLFAATELDLIVLEVGLGGRLDAVNIVDADVALITSIDLDHTAYLGNTREAVGLEKAHIMRAGRVAVVSDPVPPHSIATYAQSIGADVRMAGRDFHHEGDRQQWKWKGRSKSFNGLAYPALRGANQLLNAAGVLAVFEALHERLPIAAQAVRSGLANVALAGRFQIIAGQPTMVLDVAHNPHAAATLAVNLDQMGFFPRTHAVFGAMADKDLARVIEAMKGITDAWYLCDLPVARAATAEQLQDQVQSVLQREKHTRAVPTSLHSTPGLALKAALGAADPADRIVVFGSFYTVGGVMKDGLPKTRAPHGQ
jgi:dihydrofolate synthase / folylpolyglutamate synthase